MTGSDTDRHYTWDAADQLKAFSIQVGTSEPSIYAQYLYSGGQRIKKIVRTAGGDYEITVYDGSFEYCKKVSGSTTYEKNYAHIEGAATVRTGNGTNFPGDITDDVVYNLGDNIGSINVRLSTTGTLIDREEYYPFGDTSLRTFTYKRYRYVNKEKDQESGLYYYGARYYAAWTCRFISVDPLAAKYPFYTPYQYAGNKPINSIDIDGMEASGSTGQEGTPNIVKSANGTPIEINEQNEAGVDFEMTQQQKFANKGGKFQKGNPELSEAKFKKPDNLTTKPAYQPAPATEKPLTPMEKNPTPPGLAEEAAMKIVSGIAIGASVKNVFNDGGGEAVLEGETKPFSLPGLNSKTVDGNEYITDTDLASAERFNMWVNNGSAFFVDEALTIEKYGLASLEFQVVDKIMGDLVSGQDPENYVFPENGIISSQFLDSDLLQGALKKYKETGDGSPAQYSFGGTDLVKDAVWNATFFNMTGLAGSVTITITPSENGLSISIFNISSITSGAFGKEALGPAYYPISYVRSTDVNNTVPYGNTSQTFKLFIPNGSY